jgi:hypothetical protein
MLENTLDALSGSPMTKVLSKTSAFRDIYQTKASLSSECGDHGDDRNEEAIGVVSALGRVTQMHVLDDIVREFEKPTPPYPNELIVSLFRRQSVAESSVARHEQDLPSDPVLHLRLPSEQFDLAVPLAGINERRSILTMRRTLTATECSLVIADDGTGNRPSLTLCTLSSVRLRRSRCTD